MPPKKTKQFFCVICGAEVEYGRKTCGRIEGENGPCLQKLMARVGVHKAKDPTLEEIKAGCEEAQASWTDWEWDHRRTGPTYEVVIGGNRVASVGRLDGGRD